LQGIQCKALSLENGQFSGETLSVSSQDLKTNANTPGLRVGGVTSLALSTWAWSLFFNLLRKGLKAYELALQQKVKKKYLQEMRDLLNQLNLSPQVPLYRKAGQKEEGY